MGLAGSVAVGTVDIEVRDPASEAVVLVITVRHGADLRSCMQLANSGGAQDADSRGNTRLEPVAGRIDAPPSDMAEAVNGWLGDLGARRRSRATISQYGAEVRRAIKEMGWTRTADFTAAAVAEYMAGSDGKPRWKNGATYNRALCCFRSLGSYLVKTGRLAQDPLAHAGRAAEDGGEGARAATLDEARAMVAYAAEREACDGRCRGHRSLYWQVLFTMGMRDSEPGLLEWRRHVFLDDPVPHVLFTKEINKNRRLQAVPIHPETAALLADHRAAMKRLAASTPAVERVNNATGERSARPVDPDAPGSFVFPWVPPRATFRKDRDACGIEARDRRGRGFSSHSARKFFETWLVDAGAEQGVVDRLMRHAGGMGARYYDGDLKNLSRWTQRLPKLRTVADLRTKTGGGQDVQNFTITAPVANDGLKTARPVGNVFPATSTTPATDSSRSPDPGAPWSMSLITVPSWSGDPAESSEPAAAASPPWGPSHVSHPGMPIPGLINADRTALADLLEAVARLLREPAHASQPQPRASA